MDQDRSLSISSRLEEEMVVWWTLNRLKEKIEKNDHNQIRGSVFF